METENVTDKKQSPLEEGVEFDIANDGKPDVETDGEVGAQAQTAADEAADGQSPGEEQPPAKNDELAEARLELARHREAMLRMQAEMENLRKRLMRDLDRSRKLALERIMKDLLQVWDSLERGLGVDPQSLSVESLAEGQQLTLRMLEKVMQDHDVVVIDPQGQPFDPEWHQAVTVMPSADVAENTVIEVLQKGFSLHDRLIRPAMVVVSGKA